MNFFRLYGAAVLFHLLPIIPFALGYTYVGVAAILLVALAYIKVQKLKIMQEDQLQKFGKADESIPPALEFWERITFIRKRT